MRRRPCPMRPRGLGGRSREGRAPGASSPRPRLHEGERGGPARGEGRSVIRSTVRCAPPRGQARRGHTGARSGRRRLGGWRTRNVATAAANAADGGVVMMYVPGVGARKEKLGQGEGGGGRGGRGSAALPPPPPRRRNFLILGVGRWEREQAPDNSAGSPRGGHDRGDGEGRSTMDGFDGRGGAREGLGGNAFARGPFSARVFVRSRALSPTASLRRSFGYARRCERERAQAEKFLNGAISVWPGLPRGRACAPPSPRARAHGAGRGASGARTRAARNCLEKSGGCTARTADVARAGGRMGCVVWRTVA